MLTLSLSMSFIITFYIFVLVEIVSRGHNVDIDAFTSFLFRIISLHACYLFSDVWLFFGSSLFKCLCFSMGSMCSPVSMRNMPIIILIQKSLSVWYIFLNKLWTTWITMQMSVLNDYYLNICLNYKKLCSVINIV